MEYRKKLGLKGVTALEGPVNRLSLFHYLHKKNRAIVPKLDQAIKTMLDEGTIDKILDKFSMVY